MGPSFIPSADRCTLGVDPGLDGAAVLLDPTGKVLVAVAWHSLSWSVRILPWDGIGSVQDFPGGGHSDSGIHEHKVSDLHAVGVFIHDRVCRCLAARQIHLPTAGSQLPELLRYRLAVEGLFGSGPTLAGLAWEAGLVAGPLLSGAVGEVERPKAMTWRPAVLGIRGNDANAGRVALRLAPVRFPGLGTLSHWEHACEAACIAEYVRTADRKLALPPQPSLPLGKPKRAKRTAIATNDGS